MPLRDVMTIHFFNVKAENEMRSLQRKNQILEAEQDQMESRLKASMDKLHEASKVVDEFER